MLFVRALSLETPPHQDHPFDIPALVGMKQLSFPTPVTFLIGENGSGKSTLIEAMAVAAGFGLDGGSKNLHFREEIPHTELSPFLRLVRNPGRESDGFFLRAESFYNVASQLDEMAQAEGRTGLRAYGGKFLHGQSHGESFLATVRNRFVGHGLYLLDEPESALSPQHQLALVYLMHQLASTENSQFIVATHSPILIACPGATIYELSERGIHSCAYEESHLFGFYRGFLQNRQAYLRDL